MAATFVYSHISPRGSCIICERCLLVSSDFHWHCFDWMLTVLTTHITLIPMFASLCLSSVIPYIHRKATTASFSHKKGHFACIEKFQGLNLCFGVAFGVVKPKVVPLLSHWLTDISCRGLTFRSCDPSFHTEFSAQIPSWEYECSVNICHHTIKHMFHLHDLHVPSLFEWVCKRQITDSPTCSVQRVRCGDACWSTGLQMSLDRSKKTLL